jgi:predicted nucleic acid-binding protein
LILVDSDILIANLRGIAAAREWLERAPQHYGPLATSVVVLVEIAGGMRSHERTQVQRLLSSLRLFPAGERTAWRAAEYRRMYRRSHREISIGDYLLAATAAIEGIELATLNVKHYPMFPRLAAPFTI